MSSAPSLQSTTQQFLDIHDITNNMVFMKDGSASLILTVNAINFGLFAEEEQDAVIYAYAGLLNSLNYPIQIVIKSQTKDVTAYLKLLQDQEEQTADEAKRQRIRRYREFVADLIHEGNVLDKKFYVVIPASALEMGLLAPQTVVPGVKSADLSQVDRSQLLEKAKNILEPKRDHLIAQFARIGLQARQLSTQEIIQLFYTSYNPEATEGQEVTDTKSYTTPVVSAAVQTGLMNTLQGTQSTPAETPVPEMTTAPTAPPAVTPAPTDQSPAVPTPAPVDQVAAPVATPVPTPVPTPQPVPTPVPVELPPTQPTPTTPPPAAVPEMTSPPTAPGSFVPTPPAFEPSPPAAAPAEPAPISAVPPAVSAGQTSVTGTNQSTDQLTPLPEI